MAIKDRHGAGYKLYRRNSRKILISQSICAICGRPVDKELKAPDPMSPTIDHIIPVSKGGHLTDLSNLQLTHRVCNLAKRDKIIECNVTERKQTIRQSCDWKSF